MNDRLEGDRYGIGDDEEMVDREQERLRALARLLDPQSIEAIGACGITSDWPCLEVGAGSGSLSAWMAEQVGADGRVMSLDIDLRFHGEVPDNVIVRQADIVSDKIPTEHFDVVRAWAMRGGEDSGEWWFAALEHTAPQLVAAGVLEEAQVAEALAQARADGFVMMGPVAMTVRARRPLSARS